MIAASATVVVAIASALTFQADQFRLADMQQTARQEAREHAHSERVAADKRAERRAAREARRKALKPSAPAPAGSPRDIARSLFGARQYACIDHIITHESGWNVYAVNPSSGAYGLGQSLPGSKMQSAGPDWRNSAATQLRWIKSYVNGRYGSACGAWSFWQNHNFY